MKKASFYTVLESNFFPLGSIWAQSLLDIMDEKINKIFIYDIGLLPYQKQFLSKLSDKIKIFGKNETIRGEWVHDPKWREAVSRKTRGLLEICQEENYPIVMMDSDTMVISDISDEIHQGCNFQVCERKDKFTNGDGHWLTHIGCWFVVHNDQGKEFLSNWSNLISTTEGAHRETPALCALLAESKSLNYTENIDTTVCAPKYKDEAKVLHFKSEGPNHKISLPYERINMYIDHSPQPVNPKVSYKISEYASLTPLK